MTYFRALLLAGLLVGCGAGSATTVPFDIVPLSDPLPDGGTVGAGVRFVIQFEIGDAGPIQAYLDTGSSGIQLLQDSVSPAVIAAISSVGITPITEEFESGIEATGVVALAPITLGTLTTSAPIPILLIQSLSCAPGFPCASSTAPLQQEIFSGYAAIVGVGMRNVPTSPPVGNPIAQLPGEPSFIVQAPAFGGSSGTLQIGPAPSEVAAFQTVQLESQTGGSPLGNGTPAWDDTSVAACVNDSSTSTQFCGNAVLDTGAPATVVEWLEYTGPEVLPPLSEVQVSVGPTTAPIGQFDVSVSENPQPGLDLFIFLPSTLGADLINLGTTIFFRYDVYFDQSTGQIGLLSH